MQGKSKLFTVFMALKFGYTPIIATLLELGMDMPSIATIREKMYSSEPIAAYNRLQQIFNPSPHICKEQGVSHFFNALKIVRPYSEHRMIFCLPSELSELNVVLGLNRLK